MRIWFAPGVIFVFLVASTGCAGIRQVSRSPLGAYEASLVALRDGFAVAWYDTRDGNPEIYLRFLDSAGAARGVEHRLTDNPTLSYEADAAAINESLAVAWYERSVDTGELVAKLGLWTLEPRQLWVRTISARDRNGRNPIVRIDGNDVFCAWIEDDQGEQSEVWAGWWDVNGQLVTPPRRIGPAGRSTWNLNAALDASGVAWLVFDATAGTRTDELFLAHITRNSANVTLLAADDGVASKYPDIAFGSGRVALTWFDERDGNKEVYLFMGAPDELRAPLEDRAIRVTHTAGESIGAYLGWNEDRLGLAWCDDSEGQHEIYIKLFDAGGNVVQEARRLTRTARSSLIPSIRSHHRGFALAWNEYEPAGPGHDSDARSQIMFTRIP